MNLFAIAVVVACVICVYTAIIIITRKMGRQDEETAIDSASKKASKPHSEPPPPYEPPPNYEAACKIEMDCHI